MSSSNFWDEDFAPPQVDLDLVKQVQGAVGQVVATVESAIDKVPGAVAPPPPVIPTIGASPIGGDLISQVQQAALEAAKQSASILLPDLEKAVQERVSSTVQAEVGELIKKLQGGNEPAVPSLSDFAKADARSRAFRTLLSGLVLSALWGILNVVGNLATVNWADKNALPQVAALAAGSVVMSMTAYISRLLREPAHIANAVIVPGTPTHS